jgi:hypothetical protein
MAAAQKPTDGKQEYLGDWVSLMSHQNAAYQLLTELYTPESIMKHGTLQNILKWYIHFDVYVAIISGLPAIISRDWFEAQHKAYVQQTVDEPDNISIRYEERFAWVRLLGYDVTSLFSAKAQGTISGIDFERKSKFIQDEIDKFEEGIHPMLRDNSKRIMELSDKPLQGSGAILEPYKPGLLYSGEIFPTNQLLLNFWGLRNMFGSRLSAMTGVPRSEDSAKDLAYRIARLIDAIDHYPESPAGALLGLRASLGMAVLFLPANEKEKLWSRRKLAQVENLGYVFATAWVDTDADFALDTSIQRPYAPSCRSFGARTSRTGGSQTIETFRQWSSQFETSITSAARCRAMRKVKSFAT